MGGPWKRRTLNVERLVYSIWGWLGKFGVAALDSDCRYVAFAGQVKTEKIPPRFAVGKEWDLSRRAEIDAWINWGALEVVAESDYAGCDTTPCLWVYTRKETGLAKSRLWWPLTPNTRRS